MGNVSNLRNANADDAQIARAQRLHGLLTEERWSVNKAAAAMGMSKSTLASRFRGETPFLADEIALIAGLLRRDPVELYREYLLAPTGKAPTPGGGGLLLPELDSNQQPAGNESAPETRGSDNVIDFGRERHRRNTPTRGTAPVTPIRALP